MAAVTSPARHAASLATSASNREPRRSKVHRAMEWPKLSSAPSSVITSASVRARMQTPSCTSYQLGSITTTRFTRTRHSDIVHPVSSSQLTEARDRVRSFGGYNIFNGGVSFAVEFYDNFFFTTFMVLYVIGVRCPRRQEQRSDTNQYGFTVMGHFLAFWRKDRRIETENRHDCWAIRYNVRFRGGGYDHSSSLDV